MSDAGQPPTLDRLEPELEAPLLPVEVQPDIVSTPIEEALRLASLGWPLVVEEVVTYGSTMIAIGMVGRLGPTALSVFSLARSVTNITGISYLVGVTGGIETFCSQSYGAGGHRLVGVTLQRGIYVTLAFCAPVLIFYTQVHRVLAALGQEQDLADAAGRYIRLYCPLVPIHGVCNCIVRYLISQGAVASVMLAGTVFFLVTLPICWLLIFKLGLGLDGSALAAVACDVVYLLALVGFAVRHNLSKPPHLRPWQGWSLEAFTHWGPYLKVAGASILMVILDWWVYDVATLLAGMLPNPDIQLGAMGISYNINAFAFMVPFGLAFAVCARVGISLGAGHYGTAKLSAEVGTGMALGIMGVLCGGLLLAGAQAARPFSDDPQVLAAAAQIMPPLALALVANGGTAVLAGVLRGCGRQKYGAAVNFVVNWVIGLAAMVLLAFRLKLGGAGLWWGLCISSYVQTLALAVLVAKFNWRNESDRAGKLVRRLSQNTRRSSGPSLSNT